MKLPTGVELFDIKLKPLKDIPAVELRLSADRYIQFIPLV